MIQDGKEILAEVFGKQYHCALNVTMDYIGGKWKTVILWYLIEEKKRFRELCRLIPDITERMLTLQLRDLEEKGLIDRKVYAEVPPKVEYSLTEFGRTLIPSLNNMAEWGRVIVETKGKTIEVSVLKKSKLIH